MEEGLSSAIASNSGPASDNILGYAGPSTPRQAAKSHRWPTLVEILVVIGIIVLLVSILLPNLCSSSERANRVKCSSNLRQIGQGILLYANDHGGRYPARFEELLLHCDINAEVFICPSTNHEKAIGNTLAEVAADMGRPHRCSYVYCGAGLSGSSPGDTIVAYELMENHETDGINVLYNDGHVEWHARREAQHIVEELKAGHNPPWNVDGPK